MYITSEKYLSQVTALIEESDRLDIAVAFWGEGSNSLLARSSDKLVRVICNLASGGTNPHPIEQLLKQGVNLRQLDDLHAKVVLGSQSALVGSANFSTNGLQLEGSEVRGWSEAGLSTCSASDLHEIAQWFEAEWDRARPVEASDLKRALSKWKLRRAARPRVKQVKSLIDFSPADVKDRNLYVIIWGEEASEGANAAYEQVVSQAEEQALLEQPLLAKLDFYEDWSNLPKDGTLISFQSHSNGRYSCDGVWRRVAELDVNPGEAHGGLQIVLEQDDVLGIRITGKQRKDLEKNFRPVLDALSNEFKGPNGGAVIPLDKVLEKLHLQYTHVIEQSR
jgi:hypothetical protein